MSSSKGSKDNNLSIINKRLSGHENRRQDTGARDIIDVIQDLLFDPDASDKVFGLVLDYLEKSTASDFCVCYVNGLASANSNSPNVGLKSIYASNNTAFVNEAVLSVWLNQKTIIASPIFYNAPLTKAVDALILKNVDVSGIMLLPFILHKQLKAVCVLAKSSGNYEPALFRRLTPIIGAVVCALQSAESVSGNFLGLDEKIANNRFLSSLISSSPIGVLVVDEHNKIMLSNPTAQDMFNTASDPDTGEIPSSPSLIFTDINSIIPNYESLFQWSKQRAQYGQVEHENRPRLWPEQVYICHDGSERMSNLTIFRYSYLGKRYTTLQIQDITAIHKDADQHKRALQQLNALTQLLPVAIVHVNLDWHCLFANDKWFEYSGMTDDENKGADWINAIHPNDVGELLNALHTSLLEHQDYKQEVRLVSPLGATKWVDFSSRVLFDTNGEVEGFLGTFADVTERYIIQEKLRHVAEYDGLTGLANRFLLQDRLKQVFHDSQRDSSVVSLFFLDLDGFKDINDTLGHNTGDILLQKVADRLLNTLRKSDTIARFGGDEFVVLLGKTEQAIEAHVVAEKVIEEIAKPYVINEHEIFITTSLGIAQGNYYQSDTDTLLKNADLALYSAKREGKNKYQFFSETLDQGTKTRIELMNQMRTGLKRKRFHLCYQAIANAQTQNVTGFEALLRFTDTQDKVINPDLFIPILEETGMILDVGKWVIDEVCRQLAEWIAAKTFPEDGYIAFNVSAKQLLDEDFIASIRKSCLSHQINPAYLVMEMTESVIINKPKKTKAILDQIRSFGIRLALDDFGTGYSSLSYLQNYPFDILKIDKSFIDDLSENSNDTKITKAIIALANSLQLKVCAEGVETMIAQQVINALGADMFQGFYLSKPIVGTAVVAFLAEQSLIDKAMPA